MSEVNLKPEACAGSMQRLVRPESEDAWYVSEQNGKPMWKFIMPSKGSGSIDNFDFVNESFIRKCANIMLGKPVTDDGADNLIITKSAGV